MYELKVFYFLWPKVHTTIIGFVKWHSKMCLFHCPAIMHDFQIHLVHHKFLSLWSLRLFYVVNNNYYLYLCGSKKGAFCFQQHQWVIKTHHPLIIETCHEFLKRMFILTDSMQVWRILGSDSPCPGR